MVGRAVGYVTWEVLEMKVGIIAHPERLRKALDLSKEVGGAVIFVDHGEGIYETHRRAWVWASRQNERALLLEDDAVPVEGALEKAEEWAEREPRMLSLYLGTGHPRNHMRTVDERWNDDSDVVDLPTLIHHVAVLLPDAEEMCRIIPLLNPKKPCDFSLGDAYREATGQDIPHVKESLFDHEDSPSLVQRIRRLPRKARLLAT